MGAKKNAYEVHEHSYVSGPFSCRGVQLVHSHEGGDRPHQHPETGPASYTIDKDEWLHRTGLKGGGRKKFTKKPSGVQPPVLELEDWQRAFEVHVDEESCKRFIASQRGDVTGSGESPIHRMALGFGMKPMVRR